MGQGLVEREAERRVRSTHVPGHRVKVSLHAGIGRGAEEDKLRAALNAVADGVLDEVETLLRGEARHDSNHGLVGAPGETETGLERLARGALAGLVVVGVVIHGEELVRLGVPDLGVDAVAHAVELVEVLVHRGVAGNLAGVRGGHGGGDLRVEARLPDLHLPVVHVVDGEHNLGLPKSVVMVVAPVRRGNLRGGPIVAVEDVGLPLRAREELQRRVAEVVELDAVVVPAVHGPDVEEAVLGFDEENLDALHDAPLHHDGGPPPLELRLVLHPAEHRGHVEERVLREDDLHHVALVVNRARERGDHVAEAANLRDGRHLDGDVDDVQRRLLLRAALDGYVVILAEVVVVRAPLRDAVAEDKVHHPRILRDFDLARHRRPDAQLVGVCLHLNRPRRLRVRPAVEPPGEVHLLRHAEVGVLRVVGDGHLLARHRVRGLRGENVLRLAHGHLASLLARLRLSQPTRAKRLLLPLRLQLLLNGDVGHPLLDARVPLLVGGVAAALHEEAIVVAVVVVPRILSLVRDDHVDGVRRGGNLDGGTPPVVLIVHLRALDQLHGDLLLETLGKLVEAHMDANLSVAADRVHRLVEHHLDRRAGLDGQVRLDNAATILVELALRNALLAVALLVLLHLDLLGGLLQRRLVDLLIVEVLLDLLLGLAVVNLLVPVLTAVVVVHVVSLEHAVKAVRQLGDDKVGVEEPAGTRGLHRRVKLIQLPVVETRLESDAVPAAEDAAVRGVDVNLGGLPGDELLGDGEVEVSARRVGDVVNRGFGNLDLDVGQELLLLPLRLLSLRDGPRLSLSLHARSLGRLPLLRLVRQSVELSLLRELELLLLRGDGGGDFLLGHLRGDGHLLGGHAGRGRGDPGDARGGTVGVPGSPVHRSGGVAVRGAVHARGGRNGRAVGGRRRGGHHGRRGSVDRRGQAVGGPLGRGRRRSRLGRRGRRRSRLGRRGRRGRRRLGRRRGRRLRRRRRGRRGSGCRVESRVRISHVE